MTARLRKGFRLFTFCHTYPGTDDGQGLHDWFVEREKEGMAKRKTDEPGHVVWVPAKENIDEN